MKVKELLHLWEESANGQLTLEEYRVRLPVEDAAKLEALAEIYPRRAVNDIITDLLCAALSEVETSLPYVRGETVVARDELGDPLYEDIGPTPRYLSLTQKHMTSLQSLQQSKEETY